MNEIIWAICLDEELEMNPNYWVIARDYDLESEARAETSLQHREEYRVTQHQYSGEKLQSGTYAVEGQILDGGAYKLTVRRTTNE
ncbi:MAG: hypothetical protein MI749_20615 [Desulfovibrionales bacterium]|nr:hypothetical protein [Desulfovibrionales bacterium]